MVMDQIITSILDNDFYNFLMQQAVLYCYPPTNVSYKFYNRGTQKFSDLMVAELRKQVDAMGSIRLTNEEYSFLFEKCPNLTKEYLDLLKTFSFKPKDIQINVKDGNLLIDYSGNWFDLILWETPLLALISELYFKVDDFKWSYDPKLIVSKGKILDNAACHYIEFGTRRRRSKEIQEEIHGCLYYYGLRYLGTSNPYMAMVFDSQYRDKNRSTPKGTVAHQWIMAAAALNGVKTANYTAMQKWLEVYDCPGVALTDTYTTTDFLRFFNKEFAERFSGVRHDSGHPIDFGEKIVAHYKSLGIDPKNKTIVFSDSLNPNRCAIINAYFSDHINCQFGIGTNFTNDVKDSNPLNIVIKLDTVNDIPVVKLSDDVGKACGNEFEVRRVRSMLNV